MTIVNAVLVLKKGAPIWVEDDASIAQWGRIEDQLSVGEIDDEELAAEIGAEWLAARSQPLVSHTYKALDVTDQLGAIDYFEGDTLAEPDLRVVSISLERRPDGRFQSTPVFATRREERMRRSQARVQRMIAEAGGTSPVSARPAETGSGIEAGKLNPKRVESWTWVDSAELDPLFSEDLEEDEKPWQQFPIDEPVRLSEMELVCDWKDEDDEPVADGETRFRLMINGVAPVSTPELGSIPTDVWVTATQGRKTTPIFGGTILKKGDVVSVTPVSNGGHVNGSVTLHGTEVV